MDDFGTTGNFFQDVEGAQIARRMAKSAKSGRDLWVPEVWPERTRDKFHIKLQTYRNQPSTNPNCRILQPISAHDILSWIKHTVVD
jgi:hypothetical protein